MQRGAVLRSEEKPDGGHGHEHGQATERRAVVRLVYPGSFRRLGSRLLLLLLLLLPLPLTRPPSSAIHQLGQSRCAWCGGVHDAGRTTIAWPGIHPPGAEGSHPWILN